jgi:hypothetical protein
MGVGAHTYPAVPSGDKPVLPVNPDMAVASGSYPKGSTYRNRTWAAGQPKAYVWLEQEQAFLVADGYTPMRVVKGDLVMRVGLLPPVPDPCDPIPTGSRAQAHLQLTANPNPGDAILLGDDGTYGSIIIYFVATLITDPTAAGYKGHQILIGATPQATMQNLADFTNDNPGYNSTYHNAVRALGFPVWDLPTWLSIEVDETTLPGQVDFQTTFYGARGNNWKAQTFLDTAGAQNWLVGGGGLGVGMFVNGLAGTGTAPEAGDYEYTYRYYRKHDHALSGIGTRVFLGLGEAMNVDVNMTDPGDDPLITQKEWLRSLHKSGQFYAGGRVDVGTASDTDDVTDEELGALGLPLNILKYRPYESGHVPSFRCVEYHLGRVYGGGAFLLADKEVSLDLTEGSYDAVITAGTQAWTHYMEGGIVTFDNFGGEEFLIVDIDGANVRLNKPWPHTTGTEVGDWRDGRDPTELAWSEPTFPNQWPPANTLEGVSDDTGEGITGLKSHWERLNIFTPESIYALSGVDGSFQLRRIVEGVGTASHHGIVEAEGNLYFPHNGAFFAWGGDSTPINITNPPGEPRGLQDMMERINWRVADQIVGHFDALERVIRWAVPLDGSNYVNAILVWDLQHKAWHVDFGLVPDVMTSLTAGGTTVTAGFTSTRCFIYGFDDVDNWYESAGYVQSITGVSYQRNLFQITGIGTTVGVTCGAVIVTAAGDYLPVRLDGGSNDSFTVERGICLADEGVTTGDQVIFGGILFYLRTGQMSFGYMGRAGRVTDLDIGFVPQTPSGRLYAAVGSDGSEPTLTEFGDAYGDLTDSDGHWRTRPNAGGRRQTLDIFTAFPQGRPEIIEIGLGYRTPNKDRRPA